MSTNSAYRPYWLPGTVTPPARARQAISAGLGSRIGRSCTSPSFSRLFHRRIIGQQKRKLSDATVIRRAP